jgi:hypothetical protein
MKPSRQQVLGSILLAVVVFGILLYRGWHILFR